MSLADDLESPPIPDAAKENADIQFGADGIATGGEFSGIRSEGPLTDWSHIFEKFDLDPNLFEIIGDTVRASTWQQSKRLEDGQRDIVSLYSYRAMFRRKSAAIDLLALYAVGRTRKRRPFKLTREARTSVPVIADIQTGKVGSRGGTPELLDRLEEKRELLTAELRRRKPDSIFLPDINDLFENFESGGNPMFTNDLSLSQQMDVAATEVFKFVELAARFGPVKVAVVPSNHTAWRRGSQNLGAPGDDLGIFVHRQVEKVAKAAKLDVVWEYPEHFNESMVVDVRGTRVGMVHGNQFRDGKANEWWAKQTHGAQPVGAADILLTGHYHHLSIMPTGRNPYSGRSKWHLGAPTLDNGSDWYRNYAGDDSDPGLLLFDITDNGFDLQSLTVL